MSLMFPPNGYSRTYDIRCYSSKTAQGQDKGVKRGRRLASADVRDIIRSTILDSSEEVSGSGRGVLAGNLSTR